MPPVPRAVGAATVAAELLGDTAAPEVAVAAAVLAGTVDTAARPAPEVTVAAAVLAGTVEAELLGATAAPEVTVAAAVLAGTVDTAARPAPEVTQAVEAWVVSRVRGSSVRERCRWTPRLSAPSCVAAPLHRAG